MVEAAIAYWADHFRYGAVDDEKAVDHIEAQLPQPGILKNLLDKLRTPVDAEKIAVFESVLREQLMAFHPFPRTKEEGPFVLSFGTDYEAQGILRDAMVAAKIPTNRLPFKTKMRLCVGCSEATYLVEVIPPGSEGPVVIFPEVYEVWGDEDEEGYSLTLNRPLELLRHRSIGLLSANAKPLYATRGTWNEAMSAHHEAQGWAPYVPMKD